MSTTDITIKEAGVEITLSVPNSSDAAASSAAPASAPPLKRARVSSTCAVCALAVAKYTCPRCSVRTCSLACVRAHKRRRVCACAISVGHVSLCVCVCVCIRVRPVFLTSFAPSVKSKGKPFMSVTWAIFRAVMSEHIFSMGLYMHVHAHRAARVRMNDRPTYRSFSRLHETGETTQACRRIALHQNNRARAHSRAHARTDKHSRP